MVRRRRTKDANRVLVTVGSTFGHQAGVSNSAWPVARRPAQRADAASGLSRSAIPLSPSPYRGAWSSTSTVAATTSSMR